MTAAAGDDRDRVAALRRAFDRSFAEARSLDAAALQDLLAVTLGPTPCALRLADLSGLFADTRITPVPTRVPELLGIIGLRGSVLPVYDLRALLGHRPDAKPRWLAIAATASVGLAFDRFEGHLRVRRDAIIPRDDRQQVMRHVREVVRIDGLTRPIVSVSSVLEAITRGARGGALEQE